MKTTPEVIRTFNKKLYKQVLARGLSTGKGDRNGQMCIEAAICFVLGLPHGDDPKCVLPLLRSHKIILNDSHRWTNPQTRAEGLYDLGLAQIGSLDLNEVDYKKILQTKIIRILTPQLFREIFSENKACLDAAKLCESTGSVESVLRAKKAADAAADAAAHAAAHAAAYAAADAAGAAGAVAAYAAADAAAHAAAYAADAAGEKYLRLGAQLILETLVELKAPGLALLPKRKLVAYKKVMKERGF